MPTEKDILPSTEKPVIYEEYTWVDLDRTLVDPALSMERFYNAARACGAGGDVIENIKNQRSFLEANGISFDPLGLLKSIPEDNFKQAFLTDQTSIVYPDANPFIDELRRNGINFNILTYGTNTFWQELKLNASGFNGNGLIIDTPRKLEYFISQKTSWGDFKIDSDGTKSARKILLIDDKPLAFYNGEDTSLPENFRGVLVNRDLEMLKGKVIPPGVEVVRSLNELTINNSKIVVKNIK